MRKTKEIVLVVVSLLSFGLAIWGLWELIRCILSTLSSLPKEVSTGIVSAVGLISLTVIGAFVNRYFEKKREIELKQREKKIEVYDRFLKRWFEDFLDPKEMGLTEEKRKYLAEFTREVILWSGNGVVKKYTEFRRAASSVVEFPHATFIQFEEFLFEIRRELGLTNKGLRKGDLLRLFINDLETLSAKDAESAKKAKADDAIQ